MSTIAQDMPHDVSHGSHMMYHMAVTWCITWPSHDV